MSENQLWKWLRDGPLPEGIYSRVESPDTSPGIPDVYYRLKNGCGWIELKFDRHPKKECPFENEKDGLHLSQRIWIRNEIEFGGRVFVVAGIGKKVAWIDMSLERTIKNSLIEGFNNWTREEILLYSTVVLDKPLKRNTIPQIQRFLEELMGN